ncbi:MAG: hypothetical protein AAGA78_02205, partial [Pseudomonadota bacterium]
MFSLSKPSFIYKGADAPWRRARPNLGLMMK